MVALSARRLVCSAIEVISFTTSPMRVPACDSSVMRWSVASAWRTASAAMPLDSWTRRVISAIELDSSSEAAAAVRTCSEAVSEALADSPESSAVVRAVSVSWRAMRSNSPEEFMTFSMMPPTPVWKLSTKWRSSALRCSAAAVAAAACSSRRRWRSWALLLNTATVRAISPISSCRSSQSSASSLLPSAIAVSEAVTDDNGLVMRRTISMVSSITIKAAMPAAIAMVCIACASMFSNSAIGMPMKSRPITFPEEFITGW